MWPCTRSCARAVACARVLACACGRAYDCAELQDPAPFVKIAGALASLYSQNLRASLVALTAWSADRTLLSDLCLVCVVDGVRVAWTDLLVVVARKVILGAEEHPECAAAASGFADSLVGLLDDVDKHWVRFRQYFAVFSQLCDAAWWRRSLNERKVVWRLLDLYLGEDSPRRYVAPGASVAAKRQQMGNLVAQPVWTPLFACVSRLARGGGGRDGAALADALGEADVHMLMEPAWFSSALKHGHSVKLVASLVAHLSWDNETFTRRLATVFYSALDGAAFKSMKPVWQTVRAVLGLDDGLRTRRFGMILGDPHVGTDLAGCGVRAMLGPDADAATVAAAVRDIQGGLLTWVDSQRSQSRIVSGFVGEMGELLVVRNVAEYLAAIPALARDAGTDLSYMDWVFRAARMYVVCGLPRVRARACGCVCAASPTACV